MKEPLFSVPRVMPKPVNEEAASAFLADEHPASHVVEARGVELPAYPPPSPKAKPSPAPSPDIASTASCHLTVAVPPGALRKLRQRALDENTTVRELVVGTLAREGLI